MEKGRGMSEPRDARDAILEVVLNRLWQDGYIVDVVLTVWAAGYMAGHHDGEHETHASTVKTEGP